MDRFYLWGIDGQVLSMGNRWTGSIRMLYMGNRWTGSIRMLWGIDGQVLLGCYGE